MRKRIGTMLLEAGVITSRQLDTALQRQRGSTQRLASLCWSLGYANESSLARILSRQLGFPFVVLSSSAVPVELLKLLSKDQAKQLNALPVHRDGANLIVAMADPHDTRCVDEVRFVSGASVLEHGALMVPLHQAVEHAYHIAGVRSQSFYRGADLDPSIELGESGHIEIVSAGEECLDHARMSAQPDVLPSVDVASGATSQSQAPKLIDRAVQQRPTVSGASLPATVLVVDDDESLRGMLVKFFRKAGWLVWQTADGRQALNMLQSGLPDAVLLDAMLPGVHGFEICRRIKNAESTKHIPVIMISAVYRSSEYKDKVRLHFGANAYVEKPLRLSHLKLLLDNCLAVRGRQISYPELSNRLGGLLQEASRAFDRGDMATAAKKLQQAVAISPFFSSIHCRLAVVYEQLGDSYRSISQYEQAAQLEPSYPILFHLARMYENTGFIRKAADVWEQCLLVCTNPKDAGSIRRHIDKLLT